MSVSVRRTASPGLDVRFRNSAALRDFVDSERTGVFSLDGGASVAAVVTVVLAPGARTLAGATRFAFIADSHRDLFALPWRAA